MQTACLSPAPQDWTSIVHVPDADATFGDVLEFSHTFDAYGVHGSLERISRVADEVLDAWRCGRLAACSLDDLRTALFMSQSAWRVAAVDPVEGFRLGYEWELLRAIRELSGGLVMDHRPITF